MGLISDLNSKLSRRRFIENSAGAAVTLGLAECANTTEQAGPSQDSAKQETSIPGKLAIIHTNDTHGHDLLDDESLGLAAVKQLRADWEEKGYEVLLMDAGDAAQGTNLVNQYKGDSAIDFMNEVGYDVMALGNHEFDFGQAKVADYVSAATFPIVSANIAVDATGKNLVDPSCVFTLRDGRKVGVFGLTTPETYTSASPLMIQGLTFKQEKELYACAQEQVDELRDQGCSLIICLGHLGEEESVAPNRAQDVAANVRGIDLLIDGHDHEEEGQTLRDAEGNETLVVEAGCYTHMVGIVTWRMASSNSRP